MGIDRLVFLPLIDASRAHRHDPVPVDWVFRTIDTIADFGN